MATWLTQSLHNGAGLQREAGCCRFAFGCERAAACRHGEGGFFSFYAIVAPAGEETAPILSSILLLQLHPVRLPPVIPLPLRDTASSLLSLPCFASSLSVVCSPFISLMPLQIVHSHQAVLRTA